MERFKTLYTWPVNFEGALIRCCQQEWAELFTMRMLCSGAESQKQAAKSKTYSVISSCLIIYKHVGMG